MKKNKKARDEMIKMMSTPEINKLKAATRKQMLGSSGQNYKKMKNLYNQLNTRKPHNIGALIKRSSENRKAIINGMSSYDRSRFMNQLQRKMMYAKGPEFTRMKNTMKNLMKPRSQKAPNWTGTRTTEVVHKANARVNELRKKINSQLEKEKNLKKLVENLQKSKTVPSNVKTKVPEVKPGMNKKEIMNLLKQQIKQSENKRKNIAQQGTRNLITAIQGAQGPAGRNGKNGRNGRNGKNGGRPEPQPNTRPNKRPGPQPNTRPNKRPEPQPNTRPRRPNRRPNQPGPSGIDLFIQNQYAKSAAKKKANRARLENNLKRLKKRVTGTNNGLFDGDAAPTTAEASTGTNNDMFDGDAVSTGVGTNKPVHNFNTMTREELKNYENQYYTKGKYIHPETSQPLSENDFKRMQILRTEAGLPLLPNVPNRLMASKHMNTVFDDSKKIKEYICLR